MRFFGPHYAESPADSSRCLAEVSDGWHETQCSRKRQPGALRCAQHEAKNARIPQDDPVIATIAVADRTYRKLERRGWFRANWQRINDDELRMALDRIAELEEAR